MEYTTILTEVLELVALVKKAVDDANKETDKDTSYFNGLFTSVSYVYAYDIKELPKNTETSMGKLTHKIIQLYSNGQLQEVLQFIIKTKAH